jgi:hypothetical protein
MGCYVAVFFVLSQLIMVFQPIAVAFFHLIPAVRTLIGHTLIFTNGLMVAT